jgi:RNA recognition motif-containing protein
MSESVERETEGGIGPTGTNVRVVAGGQSVQRRDKEVVTGRRPSARLANQDVTSFFFTNIPEEASHSDLWKLFAKFGYVGEVFLPNKLDKFGRRFGFVKYKEVLKVVDLAARLENVWFDNVKLKVNLARFRREDRPHVQLVEERHGGSNAPVILGVSFKAAMTKENSTAPAGRVDSVCL